MSDPLDEADLRQRMRRAERAARLSVKDCREGDQILVFTGGQVIQCDVHDPASGRITVTSTGAWGIHIHLTDAWGTTLEPGGFNTQYHVWLLGGRFVIGPWYTPPVERITLNGFEFSHPAARQLQ